MISSVFVYGTLKTGQCREKHWPIRPQLIVKAWIEAELYDTGPYPAIGVGHDLVAGELWMFLPSEIASVLSALDEVEGYRENAPDSNLYLREAIQCVTVHGERADAYAYVYARTHEFSGFRRLLPVHDFAGRRLAVWPEGADW